MKPNEKDKRNLIALCQNEYKNNDYVLLQVNQFEREYRPSNAVWWYTHESFVYRILNKALRVQNVEVLFLFGSIIQGMHVQLCEDRCVEPVQVYRGQWMAKSQVNHLRKSIGNLISMNAFLSTSLDRDVALKFLFNNENTVVSDDFIPVLFEIHADPQVISNTMNKNSKPFANISELSGIDDESEVLFMLGSIFCLNQICHDQSSAHARMSIIRMTLCSDHDNDLKQLYYHMKNKYHREKNNLLSLGHMMLKMGKFDVVEKYYRRLLSELPSNDPSLSRLYHNLGWVANTKGEYDTSLKWYQKSLEIDMRTRPSDHVNIGTTHNSIGAVHRHKGDHNQALESYNRAVSLYKQAHDEDHADMAMFYNNIGIIYQKQKKYLKALDFYEKSLVIWKTHLPYDHPALGGSYNNIGIVYRCVGHYDLALEHFNRSLEIRFRSLPAQHPDVAATHKSIGLVYEDKGELEQALASLEKASTIYQSLLPSHHPNVVKIKENVRRVEDKLNRLREPMKL